MVPPGRRPQLQQKNEGIDESRQRLVRKRKRKILACSPAGCIRIGCRSDQALRLCIDRIQPPCPLIPSGVTQIFAYNGAEVSNASTGVVDRNSYSIGVNGNVTDKASLYGRVSWQHPLEDAGFRGWLFNAGARILF
jgi:hypothetical protein